MEATEENVVLKNLLQLRMSQGLTQKQLAQAAGLYDGIVISRLETGCTKHPRIATVMAIAKALGVSVEELVGSIS